MSARTDMDGFTYKSGELHAEAIPLSELARAVGSPAYVYSKAMIAARYKALTSAFSSASPLIAYAMKANSNQAILKLLARWGAGADIVSGGELKRALAAGIDPKKIVFSGVAKTEAEMAEALRHGILCFNVESEPELHRLNKVAGDLGLVAPVSLRINPDVDAKTHHKISTGKAADKFGISWLKARDVYQIIADLPHVKAHGVDMHIGSQITEAEPFKKAFSLLADLVQDLRADGHEITHVDLGGGFGISYQYGEGGPDIQSYARDALAAIAALDCQLVLEPGRFLVGNAGLLLTRVEYVKKDAVNFVITDAGMNDLLRPTLYEAHHDILPVIEKPGAALTADIVGPVCETGDYFARSRELIEPEQGDLLAIMDVGAYGSVMASTYNSRPHIAEVLVDDDRFSIIRPRQTIEDLIAQDEIPDWL